MPMHTVKPGESLSSIAVQYGLSSWQVIYKHKANKEYFKYRSKDKIYPGDHIFVPEAVNVATGSINAFAAKPFARVQGWAMIKPDVALKIVENLSRGEPPWRPELGEVGGVAWFTIEGNPYASTGPEKNIRAEVELTLPADAATITEADLLEVFESEYKKLEPTAEADYRRHNKIPPDRPLNRAQRSGLLWRLRTAAEKKMWERIGERVAQSKSKAAVIEFKGEPPTPGSPTFSSTPGKFAVVADSAQINLKENSPTQLLDGLEAKGIGAEPVVVEAASKLATTLKWAGRVRAAFRYGGRVLIVIGIAVDVYRVYRAKDKVKAVVTSLAGWGGAIAAAEIFAVFWTPADVAGPLAWAAHGVGTLIAGGVGYWIGSTTTRIIYELEPEDEE